MKAHCYPLSSSSSLCKKSSTLHSKNTQKGDKKSRKKEIFNLREKREGREQQTEIKGGSLEEIILRSMDSDLWISRLAAAKRHYSLQHHQNSQLDRLGMDDFEVEEEIRPDFPCPYCYEDHDMTSLCTHLEDEHPFESKVAICPICSVKVARDMLSHITLQHGHLFKLQRRRRLRRVAIPNSQALSLLGRDLREAHLQVLLGSGGYQSSNNTASTVVPDSLLSSLVLNFPTSEVEEPSKSTISAAENFINKRATPLQTWKSSLDLSLSHEEREQKRKQVTVRATFVQDLLLSTLFGD